MGQRRTLSFALVLLVALMSGCATVKKDAPAGIRIVKTWFSAPADLNEARAIWGPSKTSKAYDEAIAAFETAREDPSISVLRPLGTSMAADLETALLKERSGLVVLMGHSDSNGVLRLADGTGVDLLNIASRTGGAKLIVISCNSKISSGVFAGIPTSITPDLAFRTRRLLDAYLSQLDSDPVGPDLQRAVEAAFGQALSEMGLEPTKFRISAIATVGVGGAALEISQVDL